MAGESSARPLDYPPALRLLNKAAFEVVYARGRRSGNAVFGLSVLERELGVPRLGMSVGVKVAGSAVERNRIRRVIRESFRLAQHDLVDLDMVVTARGGARGVANAQLRASLAALWSKWAKPCGASSKP